MDYIATEQDSGRTIKSVLQNTLHLSGKMIIRLKKLPDGILLDGMHATVRKTLQPGQVLRLAFADRDAGDKISPTALPLAILYEDDWLIAVDKPPHMPTHPSANHWTVSVANGLVAYFQDKGIPFVFRCPSRLDLDTSGVLLVAKNAPAAAAMNEEHLHGTFEKSYYALVTGIPSPRSGVINLPIGRAEGSIINRCVVDKGAGDSAQTCYETLGTWIHPENGTFSLLRATPVTGRTHQLRVHFAAIGCPILDDTLYGDKKYWGVGRQALHAASVTITHPYSGERMTFSAPIPRDMAALSEGNEQIYFDQN